MEMRRILTFIADRLLTPAFWILLIFGFDEVYVAVLTLISALIHEAGHLIAAGPRIGGIRYTLSGPRIGSGTVSYKRRILTLAGGPVANF